MSKLETTILRDMVIAQNEFLIDALRTVDVNEDDYNGEISRLQDIVNEQKIQISTLRADNRSASDELNRLGNAYSEVSNENDELQNKFDSSILCDSSCPQNVLEMLFSERPELIVPIIDTLAPSVATNMPYNKINAIKNLRSSFGSAKLGLRFCKESVEKYQAMKDDLPIEW